ncbi:MAG: VWA domain-containing protein [Bacteroidetes bacterium]|nr:MAG: VWA domain-containing protein [Bacteroidota bacterium]
MRAKLSWLVVLALFYSLISLGQKQYQRIPEKTRILFLLDGSGSMLGKWEGTTRMGAAKRLLSQLVDSLRSDSRVELALRVYGHQFHRRLQNCKDTKLEVGFRQNNHDVIIRKLRELTPQGTTPISYSLQELEKDFPNDDAYRNIVIIITDGLESCDGDPCAVSRVLQKKRIFLRPFVIGLGMNKSFDEQFNCLGRFFDAANIQDFHRVLNNTLEQTLKQTTVSVELLDINDAPKETDVNVTFMNRVTGQSAFEFVHYRDRLGRPDSVIVDAVLLYDVIANTIPPVTKRNVLLKGGQHNIVSLKTPQGSLQLNQRNFSEYGGPVQVLVRKPGQPGVIHIQRVTETEKYLTGSYDLEILTLPRIRKKVGIEQNQVTRLEIPAPGVLNINTNVPGYGTLFVLHADGTQKWLLNLSGKTRETMGIQPGDYKLVFRAENAKGSKFTEIYSFVIKSGSTKNINLFGQ